MPSLNPYIAGNPITGSRGFFGREDVLRSCERIFSAPGQNAVIIFGQRRIGKTSILLQLQRRLDPNRYVVVYQDLMDKATRPMGEVLGELARSIALEVGIGEPPDKFDDEGIDFQRQYLPKIYQGLPTPEHKLVLIFDEFDVLDVFQREKLPQNVAANRLFVTLRRWMAEESRLEFAFAMGRDPKDLESSDFLATFKDAQLVRVSVLDFTSTTELITSSSESIQFSEAAVHRIYQITNGHPYFTQLICQLAYDQAYAAPSSEIPVVDAPMIDLLIQQVFQVGDHVFAWIWDGLPPSERIIASTLAHLLTDEVTEVDWRKISDTLQQQNVGIINEELETAPERLTEWQIFRGNDNGYSFTVPLLCQWIRTHKPLNRVRTELDRIDPRAERYYRLGMEEFDDQRHTEAIENFERALRLNPEHLQARLGLAGVYLVLEKLDEAVSEYEETYKRDEVRARTGLVKALFARLEKQDNLFDKITDARRILEVQPSNWKAQEQLEGLQTKRQAEIAALYQKMQASTISKAWEEISPLVEQYQALDPNGQDEHYPQVEKCLAISERFLNAQAALDRYEWGNALNLYEQILKLEPDDQDVQIKIETVQRQRLKAIRRIKGTMLLFPCLLIGMIVGINILFPSAFLTGLFVIITPFLIITYSVSFSEDKRLWDNRGHLLKFLLWLLGKWIASIFWILMSTIAPYGLGWLIGRLIPKNTDTIQTILVLIWLGFIGLAGISTFSTFWRKLGKA